MKSNRDRPYRVIFESLRKPDKLENWPHCVVCNFTIKYDVSVANPISQSPGGGWLTLGDINRCLHLDKVNDHADVDIRMFTNGLILINDYHGANTYHISQGETVNVPVLNLIAGDQEILDRLNDGFLRLDMCSQRNFQLKSSFISRRIGGLIGSILSS